MSFDLDRIKADNPIADVVCRAVQMRRNGQELVGLCPFHGERTPSFTVTPAKGKFYCFGCDAGGDVIDFVAKLHDVGLPEACEILGGEREAPERVYKMFETAEPADIYANLIPQPVDRLPACGEPLRCWNPKRDKFTVYKPVAVFPYRTDNGALIGVVIRIEIDGDKITPQLRYVAKPDGELTWSHMPFERPRPLYRLDELAASQDTVLLVEGEKCADAAINLLSRTVTTWPGGTNGVAHTDWRPLAGRAVVVWGDADQEGDNAVHGHTDDQGRVHQGIVHHLHTVGAKSVHVIPWDRSKPKGWDVADAVTDAWTADQVTAYVRTAVAWTLPAAETASEGDPGYQPDGRPARRSRRDARGEVQWGEPLDFLGDDSRPAPELLPEHVPDAIWPFVQDTAERMGVDPTGVALGCLVSCASVIDDHWKLQPKRFDYMWTESARLWAAILGPPSTIKSPQISACTRPIEKLDAAARRRHAEAERAYDAAMAAHKKAVKAGEDSEEPRYPKLERFMVEGTTVEALQEVLRDQDDNKGRQYAPASKVLSRYDEMSEFFAGLDRYKGTGSGSSDRGAYLRLYNGGRHTLDRIGRGAFSVSNWSACMIGGCQPGPIQRIAREATDDGLLQRFIWCVPSFQGAGLDRAPDYNATLRYEAIFPALSAMHPAPAMGSEHIQPITLHADGHAIREDVEAVGRAMIGLPDTSPRLKATFGKWRGLFARMLLTFHMIEVADARAQQAPPPFIDVVPVETIERTASFMLDIILPHLLRAEAVMFSSNQTSHAQWIAGYILAKGGNRIVTRDIMRAYGGLRSPEAEREYQAVMSSLVAVGWLEPEESPNPAKPTHAWQINPLVHTTFTARAERERAARQQAKETASKDMSILLKKRKAKGGKA